MCTFMAANTQNAHGSAASVRGAKVNIVKVAVFEACGPQAGRPQRDSELSRVFVIAAGRA